MLVALLKKQIREINSWLFQDAKKGKRRSKTGIVMFLALCVLLFCSLGAFFAMTGKSLCEPLSMLGLDWLYFTFMGMIAVALGVFGSVFNTYTTLYKAKDNELLLSMPIPPRYILSVRLFGVYFWSFIYTAWVYIPSLAVYLIYVKSSVPVLICGIILLFALSLFVLALSCILGYVVAKITSKLKNKSYVTVIAALAFIAAYYFVYFKAANFLQSVLLHIDKVSATVRKILPIYWFGQASVGDWLSLLYIILIIAAIILSVVCVMNRSFLRMASVGDNSVKKKYIKVKSKARGARNALLRREFKRFTSSSTYMLNCGLGILIVPVLGIVALIKADAIRSLISMLGLSDGAVMLVACAALCLTSSMNDMTAPSVSLEGKNIWIAQSLPVSPWDVLMAKLKMYLILSEIPVLFTAACLIISLELNLVSSIITIAVPFLFVLFMGIFALALNLKSPNLSWTNEVVPIKQSFSVFIAIFGGWAIVMGLGALYFALDGIVSPTAYALLCGAVIAIAACVLLVWIKKRGTRIFSEL